MAAGINAQTPQSHQANPTSGTTLLKDAPSTPLTVRKAAWKTFWSEFLVAVKEGNKQKLYELTDHSDFHWEAAPLDLPKDEKTLGYRLPEFADFARVYETVFSSKICAKILKSKPIDTKSAGYFMQWEEKGNSYSIDFIVNNDGQFRFAGLFVGPA